MVLRCCQIFRRGYKFWKTLIGYTKSCWMNKHVILMNCFVFATIYRHVNSLRPSDSFIRQYTTIIASDNGLSPGRRQVITWTNAGIALIWTLGTNFTETLSKIHTAPFKKTHFKMSSGKWPQLCLGRCSFEFLLIYPSPHANENASCCVFPWHHWIIHCTILSCFELQLSALLPNAFSLQDAVVVYLIFDWINPIPLDDYFVATTGPSSEIVTTRQIIQCSGERNIDIRALCNS